MSSESIIIFVLLYLVNLSCGMNISDIMFEMHNQTAILGSSFESDSNNQSNTLESFVNEPTTDSLYSSQPSLSDTLGLGQNKLNRSDDQILQTTLHRDLFDPKFYNSRVIPVRNNSAPFQAKIWFGLSILDDVSKVKLDKFSYCIQKLNA